MEGNIGNTLRQLFLGGMLLICAVTYGQELNSEEDYAKYLQTLLGGEREVQVEGGRVDLLLEDYAFEIEWAAKWKEAIGQSLWYGLNTNRKPGIILLMTDINQYRYYVQLNTAINYAGLSDQILVLRYPDDFKKLMDYKK